MFSSDSILDNDDDLDIKTLKSSDFEDLPAVNIFCKCFENQLEVLKMTNLQPRFRPTSPADDFGRKM